MKPILQFCRSRHLDSVVRLPFSHFLNQESRQEGGDALPPQNTADLTAFVSSNTVVISGNGRYQWWTSLQTNEHNPEEHIVVIVVFFSFFFHNFTFAFLALSSLTAAEPRAGPNTVAANGRDPESAFFCLFPRSFLSPGAVPRHHDALCFRCPKKHKSHPFSLLDLCKAFEHPSPLCSGRMNSVARAVALWWWGGYRCRWFAAKQVSEHVWHHHLQKYPPHITHSAWDKATNLETKCLNTVLSCIKSQHTPFCRTCIGNPLSD